MKCSQGPWPAVTFHVLFPLSVAFTSCPSVCGLLSSRSSRSLDLSHSHPSYSSCPPAILGLPRCRPSHSRRPWSVAFHVRACCPWPSTPPAVFGLTRCRPSCPCETGELYPFLKASILDCLQ